MGFGESGLLEADSTDTHIKRKIKFPFQITGVNLANVNDVAEGAQLNSP